jgi:23S rRNA (cytosine1962-C5)-methyltransferase
MNRSDYASLALKKGEERRLRAGHLWVFSNEVDVAKTPLQQFSAGELVTVVDYQGKAIGNGYINPNTLICVRLLDRHSHAIDTSLFVHRLQIALALREKCYPAPYYRMVFGESDLLPGLTVDRFGDTLVAQATSAGMELQREALTTALLQVVQPDVLIWKNDSSSRKMEGLQDSVEVVHGVCDGFAIAKENDSEFLCDVLQGQKTGWFYDQRDNRMRLAPYVKHARVLDLFSYLGGWGIRSAMLGAASVDCVDVSERAVLGIRENIQRNALQDKVTAHVAEAWEFLKAARAEKRKWDVVILDPPAFIKRKKDFKEGSLAYRRLAEAGMQVLERDGILIECSCSHHMPHSTLLEGMQQAARHQDRFMQVLAPLTQSTDHPVHPCIPETEYLKGYITRILSN